MADVEKPWAEKSTGEQISDVVGYAIGGLMLLVAVALLIVIVVNESRWAFTTVSPTHMCAHGRRNNCLIRTPARVKLVDGRWFNATTDRAPYHRDATLSHGAAPAVGSVVVMEDWNGRLVSVFDPGRGRRHTKQWPNMRRDLVEAATALTALLAAPMVFLTVRLRQAIKRRRSSVGPVTGERAQTS